MSRWVNFTLAVLCGICAVLLGFTKGDPWVLALDVAGAVMNAFWFGASHRRRFCQGA